MIAFVDGLSFRVALADKEPAPLRIVSKGEPFNLFLCHRLLSLSATRHFPRDCRHESDAHRQR